MSDSSDIDNALTAALGADTALVALMPNGVYMNLAPAGMTRFVLVSLITAIDIPMFHGRAFEECHYFVRAVGRGDAAQANIKAAAARLDALLDPQPPAPPAALTIPGYSLKLSRRTGRERFEERDEIDSTIVWYHRGGNYQVTVSPTTGG